MNFKVSTLLSIALLILGAYGLYVVKWEVRELKRQNTLLQAEILKEERSIRVLEAEWAYLNRPERLRSLAKLHLDLDVMHGEQLAELDQLDSLPEDGLLPGTQLSGMRVGD